MTIYGAPPLFTARIADKTLASGKTVRSPRNEQLSVERRDGLYITRSKTPFSLIPHISELGAMGFDYLVIDIRGLAGGKTIWMSTLPTNFPATQKRENELLLTTSNVRLGTIRKSDHR
jgi:hypothetical protein